jgi:hypothetical protein
MAFFKTLISLQELKIQPALNSQLIPAHLHHHQAGAAAGGAELTDSAAAAAAPIPQDSQDKQVG